jgi:phthalate 4,5-cis-dihydrodiol dehydrogenase
MTPIRLGVAGLGRAFTIMLPTLIGDPRVRLVAATDPRPEACRQFERDFGARTYASIEELCAGPGVDALYIATPHQLHAVHACLAARHGKHVLVEKPMAITLAECTAMIDAAKSAGTVLIVGPSHSFDLPILRARAIVAGGELGGVRMIHAMNYTDFMYRPRRPEELRTDEGGGVIFSQAAHQIDIVRLLGGGMVKSVRACTGNWDPARPTEGAYSALLFFANGACGSATYSGYAHYDSDELMGWSGELGQQKDPATHGVARERLQDATTAPEEAALKAARNYGGSRYVPGLPSGTLLHEQFGHIVVSCERGDIVPMPGEVRIYGDMERYVDPLLPPEVPRAEVIDELWGAIVDGRAPLHSGEWGRATTEVCLGLLASAREQRDITLQYQVGVPAQ